MSIQESLPQEPMRLPPFLADVTRLISETGAEARIDPEVQKAFPDLLPMHRLKMGKGLPKHEKLKVGVVLSGGQAPGGHNVICGVFDALKRCNPETEVFGFLGGPQGVISGEMKELTDSFLLPYRNTGGFDMIGSGRTKIETEEQFVSACKTLSSFDGLIIIGGDDSNTNAAVLAEHIKSHGGTTTVVGVPKTIDGDLQTEELQISFGFDTATKLYSELIGNIQRDALSAKKYYHFIRLMGRAASHVTLECALQCHPNYAFIAEEVKANGWTLNRCAKELADLVRARAKEGKHYGVVLIPEGLIEVVPTDAQAVEALPEHVRSMVQGNLDPHGNLEVSHIETEKLLIALVEEELQDKDFHPLAHYYGYEGRCGYPTRFDATYCYALGHIAALLVNDKRSGYMACVTHLEKPIEEWGGIGIPIPSLFTYEMRKGTRKPVIEKALVKLDSAPFKSFASQREAWKLSDIYNQVGPTQFFGKNAWESPLILT